MAILWIDTSETYIANRQRRVSRPSTGGYGRSWCGAWPSAGREDRHECLDVSGRFAVSKVKGAIKATASNGEVLVEIGLRREALLVLRWRDPGGEMLDEAARTGMVDSWPCWSMDRPRPKGLAARGADSGHTQRWAADGASIVRPLVDLHVYRWMWTAHSTMATASTSVCALLEMPGATGR